MNNQFFIYKRNGIYYGNFSTVYMQERIRLSTGCRTKSQAVIWCTKKLEEMKLEPDAFGAAFGKLAKDWWLDGKCPYQKESRRNGKELSLSYMATNRRLLETELLPSFGRKPLASISSGMIDDWKYSLHEDKGLCGKSVNTYLTVMRTMMDYWWRHGLIDRNPCLRVRWMRCEQTQRGILTDAEVSRLFSCREAWSNPMAYMASILAACTGMRMGEIQALRGQDIMGDGTIMVRHSYSEEYGLKCTKTGTVRDIPVPPELHQALLAASGLPDEYLFILDGESRPMRRSCILRNFQRALARVGVSRQEQKERNICFHSWRHYLNSRLRVSGLPDVVVKSVTGHSTDEMMEHYTHVSAKDAAGVAAVAERILPARLEQPPEWTRARGKDGRYR